MTRITREEVFDIIDEFRELWVTQLLDAKTTGERLGLGYKANVWYWAKELGLSVERKAKRADPGRQRALKAAQSRENEERKRQKNDGRRYAPPQGNCNRCKMALKCKDLWTTDEGVLCEYLLPFEQEALANGGFDQSNEPLTQTAFKVKLHEQLG